ncbi:MULTISPECIES: pre-peptidase C-terminal domain-containing protein [Nostoc]|uniref:Pre-peptidase C-terminal domain-containing protein n=1 Tax=Nostoc paludosum FACHB-159 TaxID=2692908 RepID=A0ABR8K4L1_9NOSO|nr:MULTISPECIES: pre-peptidase C-terminal domain-containing protein [Nostoc]MBD2678138.1 pre-peptidase C-terminal domain-containing protein [Nostoc sp. FACHB-857]MBD2734398.1 pre-peptidase C-terminal domain-containing protein [Nostoc paludosum FACHB-159]
MSIQDLGSLNSTPRSFNSFNVNAVQPTDIFQFSIGSTRNINLSLNNISTGDDADLRLFRDVNANGILDATDRANGFIDSSTKSTNVDDAINVRANAGTYFAEVSRFATGSSGFVFYDLDLSATKPTSTGDFSNLLPKEFELGSFLSGDVTNVGKINNNNTADVYHFSLGFFEGVNISLTGISANADADIRLIRDLDGDRIADLGEEVARSGRGLGQSEFISNFRETGDYFLQVNQFSGSTPYTINFDRFPTAEA